MKGRDNKRNPEERGLAVGQYLMAVDRHGWITMPRMLRLTFINPKPKYLHAILDAKQPGQLTLIHPIDMKSFCPEYFLKRQPKTGLQFHKIRLDRRGRFRVDTLLGPGHRRLTFMGVFNVVELLTDGALRSQGHKKGNGAIEKYLSF